MKKVLKIVIALILVALLGITYMLFIKKSVGRTPLEYVPNDAVYILETDELTAAWKHVSNTNIWQYIIKDKSFDYLKDTDEMLNTFLLDNKPAKLLLKNRPLTMSAHLTGLKTYDFLYIIDLKKVANFNFLLEKALKQIDSYNLKKLKNSSFALIPKAKKANTIYLKTIDNLLLVSLSQKLLEKPKKQEKNWLNNENFNKVTSQINKDELLNFYFNYNKLPAYYRVYFDDTATAKLVAKQMDYAAFDLNQEDDRITMNGFTSTKDTPSYSNALLDVKPGKLQAHRVISDKMALYVALSFKNYKMFYQSVLEQFGAENKAEINSYREGIRKVENYFNIDINRDLFDWIGSEIALVNVQNKANKATDVLAIIHSNDIDDAKKGLNKISEQIRKKSPFKFKKYSYHNYEINYLHNKGFFEVLFSKLFSKIQKPYFTYIEDFVIFSNSELTLKLFIDDYSKGHTLSHDTKFMDLKNELSSKSTVSVFVQTPKLYANLYRDANANTKQLLKEKEPIILSFNRIGFQLISSNNVFETKLVIDHDKEAAILKKMDDLLVLADDSVRKGYFEYVQFKTLVPDTLANLEYKKYYNNQQLALEGKLDNSKPDGLWRAFYPSGNTKYAIHYDDGKVDGEALFYYDDKAGTPKVITNYNADFIAGSYQEFYKNGQEKVHLNYDNGVLYGEAKYYYPSGKLKIVGKYKKGKQKGKWLYYDVNSKIINKVRY
jgi:hypothetical protein